MKLHLAAVIAASLLTAGNAAATAVTLNMYADDYGTSLVSGYKSNRINWLSETPWSCSKSEA